MLKAQELREVVEANSIRARRTAVTTKLRAELLPLAEHMANLITDHIVWESRNKNAYQANTPIVVLVNRGSLSVTGLFFRVRRPMANLNGYIYRRFYTTRSDNSVQLSKETVNHREAEHILIALLSELFEGAGYTLTSDYNVHSGVFSMGFSF